MLGPNRNLVGAGVGHVEEDSITAWWFRNPAITSWYGKFIPVFTGFFRGDHNLRPYILRDIPEFFAIQTWSLSYFLWNFHDMAQWPISRFLVRFWQVPFGFVFQAWQLLLRCCGVPKFELFLGRMKPGKGIIRTDFSSATVDGWNPQQQPPC